MLTNCSPGEPLPPFPKPTHSADPVTTGLRPHRTINATIAHIPSNAENHDLSATATRAAVPYDGNALAGCITTSGGHQIHPSGTRDFTHREFACLQSFPLQHRFGNTSVKKIIGNAVPPLVSKAILKSVKLALMKEDGIKAMSQSDYERRESVIEVD